MRYYNAVIVVSMIVSLSVIFVVNTPVGFVAGVLVAIVGAVAGVKLGDRDRARQWANRSNGGVRS